MKMVQDNKLVSPYFLFFLVQTCQTGIWVLVYQHNILKGAGKDAWLTVLAVGLFIHVIFAMIIYILNQSQNGDLISFHQEIFGKFIGNVLNGIFFIYFALVSLFPINSYINVLQIWVFHSVPSWEISLLISIVVFYIVASGFRVVTAITFWGFAIPIFLLLSIIYLVRYFEPTYILPLLQADVKDYFVSAKDAISIYFGFEPVLIYYPFIKNRDKAVKWGHLALIVTTLIYTLIAIATFLYFTPKKLEKLSWPTLTMTKIIHFQFLERFEFIFIFTWIFVILPIICVYMWCSIRCIRSIFPKLKGTYILIAILLIFIIFESLFVEYKVTLLIDKISSVMGIVIILGYIPLLFIIAVIRNKWKKVKGKGISS